jgi:hypothetical protein
VYRWLWRRLPGETGSKLISVILIAALVVAVLWFLLFPWAALHVPVDRIGVAG